MLGAAQTAHAAPITWTGAVNNDWNIGANADTGMPPVSPSDVISNSLPIVSLSGAGTETIDSLAIGSSGTTTINGQMIQTGVTINGGALTGEGFIRGNVVNTGGTVGPGTSPGKLTMEDDFTQGPGGTLAIEIDSLSLFDILAIQDAADLDGTLDLQVDAGYAASTQDGDTFTIIEWASFSGAFATVSGLNFGIGKFFTLDYGTSGLTLTVGSETVVGRVRTRHNCPAWPRPRRYWLRTTQTRCLTPTTGSDLKRRSFQAPICVCACPLPVKRNRSGNSPAASA